MDDLDPDPTGPLRPSDAPRRTRPIADQMAELRDWIEQLKRTKANEEPLAGNTGDK